MLLLFYWCCEFVMINRPIANVLLCTFADPSGCPDGKFLCRQFITGDVCVLDKHKCDGQRNCIDGKDEDGCGK